MNIDMVVKMGLCTSCGECLMVCPIHTLSEYQCGFGFLVPKAVDKCILCGKCFDICPNKGNVLEILKDAKNVNSNMDDSL